MDKAKLIANVIIDASERGKDYSWMYDTENYHLDRLCEELDISLEEIQDIVLARKNIPTYKDLVLHCQEILSKGWTEQALYNFMDKNSGWSPDSITSAIDEAKNN
ncbi:hypothetical protein COJ67_16740 [Bacillus thuringiensis]|uniref:hypothetical protein n=1 Tax=Bacillus thuringiensis TaxID=1428 RepID=UPI000BF90232|nr:hypothetical protein [Bacillus thuringiensis]PFN86395.1 hypothetical protein COJ67_16740 [Bacillus thuringiensis]